MNKVIKGAVIQFAAHLTTLDRTLVVGREHDCTWIAKEVEKWCVAHGMDCPMDEDWTNHMGTPDLATLPLATLLVELGQRIDTGLAPTVVHNHTEPK